MKLFSFTIKKPSKIDEIDVDKISISKKESYGTKSSLKYIIGYNDDAIKSLYIKVPQMVWRDKYLDSNKKMSFKASNKNCQKKYTKIWERIRSLMNIKLDSEAVYDDNDKFIKTKIKTYKHQGKY